MGLLTVDVASTGVVMTSDSQPIELIEGGIRVLDFTGEWRRDKIIERHASGFDGLIGFVGTETVGAATMRSVLEQTNNATAELALGEFAARLAGDLTSIWKQYDLKTCLWVFIAGAEAGELRFWFVVNGELVPAGYYVNIRPDFAVVNDLDEHAIPRVAAELGVPATQASVLALRTLLFRNGAIQQTSQVLDDFTVLIQNLYLRGHEGFPNARSLVEYAYLVKMRQEFVKRLFELKKGIWRGKATAPIGGAIVVRSVSPDGTILDHGKEAPRYP